MFAVSTVYQRVTDGQMTDGQTDIFRQHSRSVKMGQICVWPGHRPGLQWACGRRFPTPSRLERVLLTQHLRSQTLGSKHLEANFL